MRGRRLPQIAYETLIGILKEAKRAFRGYETRVDFVYLTGLPLNDLLREVANLPDRSIVYYLHVFEDGLGNAYIPADVARRISAAANAPVYGHYSTYVGGGIVGGRFVRFETEGANAADIALASWLARTREHQARRNDQEPDRGRLVSTGALGHRRGAATTRYHHLE